MPYEPMHLILSIVVPMLWKLFSGEHGVLGDTPKPNIMSKTACAKINEKPSTCLSTVPLFQARSLCNIQVHFRSYKAVYWRFILLRTGEVVLAGRLREDFFTSFIRWCQAGRLLFKLTMVTEKDLGNVDICLKRICSKFF